MTENAQAPPGNEGRRTIEAPDVTPESLADFRESVRKLVSVPKSEIDKSIKDEAQARKTKNHK